MNSSHMYRRVFGKSAAVLFGTTSILTLASVLGAQAQPSEDNVEEILVTGSLIRGSEAVGVPVTSISTQDFKETGSVSIGDMFKNIPAITMAPVTSGTSGNSSSERGQAIVIHNLDSTAAVRDLLLIDGMRFPPQGHSGKEIDPSVIPTLAVERVDVLADGASATYGSDAITGVVNVVMRRGFDGSQVQFRAGVFEGGRQYQAAGLWGRTWDGGDITLSYEWFDESGVNANKFPTDFTQNYTSFGLDDRTPITSALPGIVSTGAPSVSTFGPVACSNCYSIPKGQDGKNLTWATLLANKGTANEINPYYYANAQAARQHNAATMTLDQRLFDGVSFFADAFYNNRRVQNRTGVNICNNCLTTYTVPTTNPYYPIGAPAGLRVSFNFGSVMPPFTSGFEVLGRYDYGVNLQLPFDWHGKVYMTYNWDNADTEYNNQGQRPAVNAALGATVSPGGAFAPFTKPANVPFLNPFCDPTAFACYDQATLDYVRGWRHQETYQSVNEKGAQFDGPLFSLPAGQVKGAVGATYDTYVSTFYDNRSYNQPTPAAQYTVDPEGRNVWAIFAQLNVPVFGEANALPLLEKLDVEASWRHDQYSDVGGTSNPKVAINWEPVDGLTIRGTWGTSFRAPAFPKSAPGANFAINPQNTLGGSASGNSIGVQCVSGVPIAGSAAAATGAACGSFPGGISAQNSAGGAGATIRPGGPGIGPEDATNYGLGFELTPTGFLRGLNIQATYYKVKISGVLQPFIVTAATFNDPNSRFTFILPSDIGAQAFADDVQRLINYPGTSVPPSAASNILWINDGAVRNLGYLKQDGVDFNGRYDWDMSDQGLGSWDVGITGTYTLHSLNWSGIAGAPPVDAFNHDQAPEFGIESSPRFIYRARLGWSDGPWSVTGFMNYRSHYFNGEIFPDAAYLAIFPNYTRLQPSWYSFDLSIGYSTGTTPANDYLKDIGLQLVVQNVMDKHSPFEYATSHNSYNYEQAFDPTISDAGRIIQLTLTKDW